ncbi:MAG: MotA/TolQ/ExbB proton channel family protein [Candidatus Cloacimonetes bacterium]|nr:MotA/TolQ/ExbB proton channel family protein [Candidatus Cloacimonadota bacterium]
MDIATGLGLLIAVGMLFGPIIMAGDIMSFYDTQSLLLVIFGSTAAVLMSYTLNDMLSIMNITKNAFFSKPQDMGRLIDSIVDLGEKARRDGILALEQEMGRIQDDFLKKAMQLAVDGNEPEVIENVMGVEIDKIEERHITGISMFEALATYAPAFGMLGTVIGLIQMLKSLDDPSSIGAGMALCLITTFYGSLVANVIGLPIAAKLKRRSKQEMLIKNMLLFGVLSIHSGDNPRITRDKLETFVPPKARKGSQK